MLLIATMMSVDIKQLPKSSIFHLGENSTESKSQGPWVPSKQVVQLNCKLNHIPESQNA